MLTLHHHVYYLWYMREKFSKKYREDFSASPRFWPDLFWWIAAAVITYGCNVFNGGSVSGVCLRRWLWNKGVVLTLILSHGYVSGSGSDLGVCCTFGYNRCMASCSVQCSCFRVSWLLGSSIALVYGGGNCHQVLAVDVWFCLKEEWSCLALYVGIFVFCFGFLDVVVFS
jgi:hypothetical protein